MEKEPVAYVEDDIDEQEKKFLTRKRTCVKCKSDFYNSATLGTLCCSEHIGPMVNGVFTCCQMPSNSFSVEEYYNKPLVTHQIGCVESDHNEILKPFSYDPNRVYKCSRAILANLKLFPKAVIKKTVKQVKFLRYNRVKYLEVRNNMRLYRSAKK